MKKTKTSTPPASKSKSLERATSTVPIKNIRILYAGTCPKLTARGKGGLSLAAKGYHRNQRLPQTTLGRINTATNATRNPSAFPR